MRELLLILLVAAGCKDVDQDIANRRPMSKPVETAPATDHDQEFDRVRSSYQTTAREHLAKLDARIHELEQSARASGRQTLAELRADRDELAKRIDDAQTQAKPTWDKFQADVQDGFQRLEKRIDDAVHD